MKVAIASENGAVSGHFGHCEGFTIYTVENKTIQAEEFLANPGHSPGFLPNYLNDQGVKVVIAGGIGAGAIEIFNEKGIDVIMGISGKNQAVIKDYLEGKLVSAGSVCQEHSHASNCGEH